jgi:hypothetical protein
VAAGNFMALRDPKSLHAVEFEQIREDDEHSTRIS